MKTNLKQVPISVSYRQDRIQKLTVKVTQKRDSERDTIIMNSKAGYLPPCKNFYNGIITFINIEFESGHYSPHILY